MSRRVTFQMIAVLFALATGPLAHAETYLLSTGAPINHPWGFGARLWADLVAERTDGRIVFDVVPDAVAAGEGGELEFSALSRGVIDLAVGSSLIWSRDVPSLGLFALPCLVTNEQELEEIVTSTIGERLFIDIRGFNVVPLAWGDAGAYVIASRSGPLDHGEDLAGISLRVPEIGPVRQAFTMLGVDAIAASPRQALLQMRLGMIDGSVGRLADMNAEPDLPEAYDTWTRWPCVAEPLIFAVNRDLWAQWSTEDRVIVGQAALEAAIAQAEAARILARNQGAVLEWDDVVFVDVTRSHAMKLAQELEPVFYEWSGDVGTDLVRDAQAVLDARSP
jgi:TRAP-type C4-dicarboxylate transport system substrate-binding protein